MTAPALPEGLGEVVSTRRLAGGSIADAVVAELGDGRRVVVKRTSYDAGLEADGLDALRRAGARVPEVLAVQPDLLVIEHVVGDGDWAALGHDVATVHRVTADRFGWHRDNVIGPLPQANPWTDDWSSFYAEHRIRPWLTSAALPVDLRRRLERALDGPLQELLAHDAPASLVHGDLWSGNVVDGTWLIDPAVHHADREFDLAFAQLFGGFPAPFWGAYEEAWPLDDGWERRQPALQLYHLLVHVELFGSSYAQQLAGRLDRLDW